MKKLFAMLMSSATFFLLCPNTLAQQCEKPNMMILQDRSGSMGSTCDPPNSKWADATSAIDYITSNYGDALRFGLDLFPSNDACGTGLVYVDVGDNTASSIMSNLNAHPPYDDCVGLTPMAVSLAALNRYRQLKDPDRRNFIMLVSDGDDTCAADTSNDPVQAAADLFAGGIRTYVIGFGSGANPTVLTNVAIAGHTGNYFQADNQAELEQAMDQIVNEALVEVCDDRDNDCDQQTDEDWPEKGEVCTAQVGSCMGTGVWICNQAGDGLVCDAHVSTSPEVCDGLDNDCDGETDEDFPDADSDGYTICTDCDDNNSAINPGATEVCNLMDDDCDGATDESDPQLGAQCGATDEGTCEYGSLLCVGGTLDCVGEQQAIDEINCDNLDNDCDGLTDEDQGDEICDDGIDNDCDGATDIWDDDCGSGCIPGQQQSCGTDVGDCVAGVETCDAEGQWGPCEGGYAGSEEVCDGRDNDCDGETDEDDVCGGGHDCEPGQTEVCGIDEGACRAGVRTCNTQGYWSECAGAIDPLPEWCDGEDNDCDGLTDEGDLCDGYDVCLCGNCGPRCNAGECPAGNYFCVQGWCVVDSCCGVRCENGQECEDGVCVDRCEVDDIQCPDGKVCRMGMCIEPDCYSPGHECADGTRCIAGQCVADPCFNVECPSDQYCRDGQCVELQCQDCGADELCVDGQCQQTNCTGVSCPTGQECVDGQCAADPCNGVFCSKGEICSDGICQPDPCEIVDCPADSRCKDGYCIPDDNTEADGSDGLDGSADAGVDAGDDSSTGDAGIDAGVDDKAADSSAPSESTQDTGSGGCGCETEGSASRTGTLLYLLGLLVVFGKKRYFV